MVLLLPNVNHFQTLSFKDRTLNTETFILSFAVENLLPLSKVPKLVEFAKFLSKDVSALNGVKMDRTAATYKLREGLSYHNHKELIIKMNKYPFSINIDESLPTQKRLICWG